jgi:membrane fusion protein (multidrug efflux system)
MMIDARQVFLSFFFLLSLTMCSKEAPKGAEIQAIPVTMEVVEAHDVPVTIQYIAQTQSSHLVNIQARVTGFLEKRVYTEGEFVKKDQVLFLMDKKPFQAQVDAAKAALDRQEAALEVARLNLERVKPLAKLNALSQKDLDDATGSFQTNAASVEQAKAQLETANLNLSYCTITSPLDGITSSANQQEGTYLNLADSQLTTVSALSPIWVNFSISERQIQSYMDDVKEGKLIPPKDDQFVVRVIQVNGNVFPHKGKITFTEPFFNANTGTFLIRASVNNPEGILRPNQYVHAIIEGAIRPNAIVVPQRAVHQSAKGNYVWVINRENKAELRPVTVGDWHGEGWFIDDGIISGEKVIVDGGMNLQPGSLVKVTKTLDRNEKSD